MVEPGIIIIGSNRVAVDAVAVGVLKQFRAYGLETKSILEHEQISRASKLGLGTPELTSIDLRTKNLEDDSNFEILCVLIKKELGS